MTSWLNCVGTRKPPAVASPAASAFSRASLHFSARSGRFHILRIPIAPSTPAPRILEAAVARTQVAKSRPFSSNGRSRAGSRCPAPARRLTRSVCCARIGSTCSLTAASTVSATIGPQMSLMVATSRSFCSLVMFGLLRLLSWSL